MLGLTAGALAGFLATLPMTAMMSAGHRRLPRAERYPLPPRLIIERVSPGRGGEDAQRILASSLHYAYGALAGAPYTWLSSKIGGASMPNGVAFGLLVWTGSYLGWIPAAGILTPATRHPWRRVALMLAAHVVWGGCVGMLTPLLQGPRSGSHGRGRGAPGPRSEPIVAIAVLSAGAASIAAFDRMQWHRSPFARSRPVLGHAAKHFGADIIDSRRCDDHRRFLLWGE